MRFSGFFFVLFFYISLFTPHSAQASRRALMPVGYYAKQMDLAIIADVSNPEVPLFQHKLKVREVLQGKAQVGDTIFIPSRMSSAEILPYKDATLAVLLKKNREATESAPWQVLEIYTSPQSIAALRLLLPVYQLPAERDQLLALQKLVRNPPDAALTSFFTSELGSALSDMREATNFDLIENSLPLLSEVQRENFMTTLGSMNDLRAVPLLLAALNQPDKKMRNLAAQTLTYRYPGAPGVIEAMRALLREEAPGEYLKRTAQEYLSKRDASVRIERTSTPFHEAKALFQSGQKVEGARALLSVMENKESGVFAGSSVIAWTGEEILPALDAAGKARLRALLLRQAATQNNYLEAEHLIKLIRQMPDMALVPALQNLMHDMQPGEFPYSSDKADMLATFALRDLGLPARELGARQVMEHIQKRLKPGFKPRFLEAEILLRQLAWLADEPTWRSVPEQIDQQWHHEWENLKVLRAALAGQDEGQELVALLKSSPKELNLYTRDWVICRLGDLHEQSAVGLLLEELPRQVYHYPHAAKEALMQIAGDTVDEGAMKLLRHREDIVRRQAMEILQSLRGDKMRPLLRQILSEADFGHKMEAALMLGTLGTPEDLPLLLPYADFWKADRAVQNWAASSVASIRARFNYDINGPIPQNG